MKFTLISAMLLTAMAGVTSVNAADYKKNPFTLVYDGAITENVKGKVNIHPVKYDLHGIQIAANVYKLAEPILSPTKVLPRNTVLLETVQIVYGKRGFLVGKGLNIYRRLYEVEDSPFGRGRSAKFPKRCQKYSDFTE